MAPKASTEAAPFRSGRDEPHDYSFYDEFFRTEYAPTPSRAIHIGCTDGRSAVYLARKGYQVLGIDPDRERLSAARERAILSGVEMDLMSGDPLLLPPLPEESFCLAVDLFTAATVPDGLAREEYLRRIHRLLMRNGVLVASGPAPTSRRTASKGRPFAFGGPFVSDFTRAGFKVVYENVLPIPPGAPRLVVHARKPA